ncbi:MAG: tRNA (adenosine(37)-N6)-threonylcarbamoyltransferase complex dimerization subunit type 1 TsaB [Actinomycetota bacterium]|nr:tRNA (adenosine(37)-N6)-threonylcarbamoyltransferase complex dimerization subunit type 1 TsaB [Actinomycetota bacterium]
MLVLALDTATASVVLGVVQIDASAESGWHTSGVRAARTVSSANQHAETIGQLIPDVLGEAGVGMAELAAVVVGLGPGPFTGLRVGVMTAAALGDALGVPVYGVCTHDAMAATYAALAGSAADHTARPNDGFLVVTDARRRECYWADYDPSGARISGPHVQRPADIVTGPRSGLAPLSRPPLPDDANPRRWPGKAADWRPTGLVIGDPAFAEPLGIEVCPAEPDPMGLVLAAPALTAGRPPEPLAPLYLRRPDAALPAPRKLVTPV